MTARLLVLRPASPSDRTVILGLIESAARWLWERKKIGQWRDPWPDQAAHEARIDRDLARGRTWMLQDGLATAATITTDPGSDPLWSEREYQSPALYIRRFVVSRAYAGRGLGAELLDWAAATGHHSHDARFIRVNAWTDNTGLHAYYTSRGFEQCDPAAVLHHPSRARFQRATSYRHASSRWQFTEQPRTC